MNIANYFYNAEFVYYENTPICWINHSRLEASDTLDDLIRQYGLENLKNRLSVQTQEGDHSIPRE